jgi:hypothetical protein
MFAMTNKRMRAPFDPCIFRLPTRTTPRVMQDEVFREAKLRYNIMLVTQQVVCAEIRLSGS